MPTSSAAGARSREETLAHGGRRLAWAVGLGLLGLAGCVLLGLGGAAARPGGIWLGVPPAAAVLAVAASACLLLLHGRGRRAVAVSAGLAVPVLALLTGVHWAGVQAVSGPLLLPLAAAGTIPLAGRIGWCRLRRGMFLPLAFIVLLLAAGRSHVLVGPRGDEPHYLMVAESLLRDHDLSLERDYAEGRYARFHDAPLLPHYRVRGRHGEIYSLHAVGLSLLILPAWALAGYAGVTVFMALLSALLAAEVRAFAEDLTGRRDVADAAAWLFLLSPPILYYAGLVFSEVPAALALAYGLRRGRAAGLGEGSALGVGVAAAALPWLNVRYLPLAGLVLLHAAWRRRRIRVISWLSIPVVFSALGLALFHVRLYGFWDPRRVYGRRPEFSLATLQDGLPGLLLDQEFGLLVYAPAFALALPGLLRLLRKDRRLGIVSIVAVSSVVLTAGSWPMWRGGWNPPGRFLLPIVSILVVSSAVHLERRRLPAGALLLLGWGVWAGLAGAAHPELVHRDRDGTAPLFRAMSGAREWTGLLPGYVLAHPARHRLAALWAGALLFAIPWRSKRATPWRMAVATLGLIAAAELAARVAAHSEVRLGEGTQDRDAVRLVGRRAVAVPGWRVSTAEGEWTTAGWEWGPLYEPHRYPSGAEVGRRLPLAAGRYRLELHGELFSHTSALPVLVIAREAPGAIPSVARLERGAQGLIGAFSLPPGNSVVTLRLRGGGPILLKALRLVAQPLGQPTV